MFTFGRKHEKECALRYVKPDSQREFVSNVVDAVHDLLEGLDNEVSALEQLKAGFTEGGSGVWEQTGSWLVKLAKEQPSIPAVWRELANAKAAKVRFRVACFLNDMPADLKSELALLLLSDRSKKVVEMAMARLAET